MSGWSEADNHQLRRRVPETRHTFPPVIIVAVRGSLICCHLFTPFDQPGALPALLNFNPQLVQCIHADNASFRRDMARKKSTSNAPAPMTTVLLVRHGQTPTTGKVLPGRAKGLHLGEVGLAQAAKAGERIGALKKVSAVYASPMERTQETAAPIAKATGCRIRTRAGLNECDFGEWTGKNLADLRKLSEWRTVQSYPSGFRFP